MNLLVTGKIRGTFGLQGFFKVETFSGEYDYFLKLKTVGVRLSEKKTGKKDNVVTWYDIEDVQVRQLDLLLKLKGIDDPETAKKISGGELLVPRDMACPVQGEEFYINDLCNSVLVYEGTPVGTITGVVEGGGSFLLEVSEAATNRVLYVPFQKRFIGKVDMKERWVELMHLWILE